MITSRLSWGVCRSLRWRETSKMFVSQADKAKMAVSHTSFGGIVTTMA